MATKGENDAIGQLKIDVAVINTKMDAMVDSAKKQDGKLDDITNAISQFTFVKIADYEAENLLLHTEINELKALWAKYAWFFKFMDVVTGKLVQIIAGALAISAIVWLASNIPKFVGAQ